MQDSLNESSVRPNPTLVFSRILFQFRPPQYRPKQKKKVNNHVLEDFKEDEEDKIKEITENIVKQIPTLIDKKMDLFSSKVNQNLNGI